MKLSDFDFPLPENLIAQHPAPERDDSRLMIVDRSVDRTKHAQVKDLPQYLTKNDLLVLNNTRVFPAHIRAQKKSGGKIDLLLVREASPSVWETLIKQKSKISEGMELELDGNGTCKIEGKGSEGKHIVRFFVKSKFDEWLDSYGHAPLPPYIKRKAPNHLDKERYQTIYAGKQGAIAAPTAGLHFTETLLNSLLKRGVDTAFITLHVGIGTFKPVRAEKLSDHVMEKEWFEIASRDAEKINQAIEDKKRIIAVGTTSVRTLETAVGASGRIEKRSGNSGLFITPGYQFKVVGGVLTNFHVPRSTPYMLVSAFADMETIKRSYQEAIEKKYRFYSYGDAMLIL